MIQAINATNSKINHTSMNNKSKNNKVAFGFKEIHGSYSSLSASYSKQIYKLRKELTFYKIFPFFNRPPKLEISHPTPRLTQTILQGEDLIGMRDLDSMTERLKIKLSRLKEKVGK